MESLGIQLAGVFGQVDGFFHWLTGGAVGSTYLLSRWIFLRVLGVICLIAFVSLWVQIKGLIGSSGILPAHEYLDAIRSAVGPERYYVYPTVFWINASDIALHLVCALGVLASVALIANIFPALSLLLIWVLYLSLFVVGQDFLSFQWDTLLLEVCFVSIFLAIGGQVPWTRVPVPFSSLGIFLLWWILIRLSLESGIVKLTSGDSSWLDLTALRYHYESQPLPTWTSWFMHQLPVGAHQFSAVIMYACELLAPLLLFAIRPLRLAAGLAMILLQVTIGLTGNYNFFNLLTAALCILTIDDAVWRMILPSSLAVAAAIQPGVYQYTDISILLFGIVALWLGTGQILESFTPRSPMHPAFGTVQAIVSPFHSINAYGLFRVMTKGRPEIIVEGSNDGQEWRPYEFKWKPGDTTARPKFVEPHQPRLDWQLWFAALSRWEAEPWFHSFLLRLLQGSPDVVALLKDNPFPNAPPQYIRAMLYDYRFTSWPATQSPPKADGVWWSRTLRGSYSPVLSLRDR